MLAKRFVSGKIPREFDLKKLKKLHSSEKTAVLKNKFGYGMLVHCKNKILREKIFVLKNLTMLKRTLQVFKENPVCSKILKKLKLRLFGDFSF